MFGMLMLCLLLAVIVAATLGRPGGRAAWRAALGMLMLLAMLGTASAQVPPTTSPVYIPNLILAPKAFTAPADYVFTSNGGGTLAWTVSGTGSGITAAIQGTTQRTGTPTWVTLPFVPVAGGVTATSLTANGTYLVDASGMAQVRLHITALSSGTLTAAASQTPAVSPGLHATNVGGDICANPFVLKKSAIINIGAATTTKIVDTSGSTVIYACGFIATLAGTSPTVVLKSGTHVTTDCDTGAASLTGIFAPVTGSVLAFSGFGTIAQTAAGAQLCATTVGTGSSFQGVLQYVQQ